MVNGEQHDEEPPPPDRVIGFVSDAGVIGHILSEVRAIRQEQRQDHENVMKKIDDLASEIRIVGTAAGTANALGQSNAFDIQKLQDRVGEADEAFLSVGGVKPFVEKMAQLAGRHVEAEAEERGVQRERRRWLYVPRKAIDEAPKLLIAGVLLSATGAGVAIGTALELVK